MEIIKDINTMREVSRNLKGRKTIGFVPTMGCLHEGHKSLISRARKDNEIVIVSIFVNPTQFDPGEDYENYPRNIERDSKICKEEGVDYVFNPNPEDMYPNGFSTYMIPGENMTNIMCGISRPTHFRGVCTVLTKLFNIIAPDRAYFDEKDIQQLAIVKRMVKDMNFDIDIKGCPIVRENDGLAKSSRNRYLNYEEREAATILKKSIDKARDIISSGEKDTKKIANIIVETIKKEDLAKIDYIEILDFDTFERIELIENDVIIALAVYIGKTRLIDNFILLNF